MRLMKRRRSLPDLHALIAAHAQRLVEIMDAALPEAQHAERYMSWRELYYHAAPRGLSSEQWWLGVKLHRRQARRYLALDDGQGTPYSYAANDLIQQKLHVIDRKAGTSITTEAQSVFSENERERYIVTSLVEEAIMSSMLEGAAVTRSEAREMLRTNRPPVNKHERMVLNNYSAMQMIMANRDRKLTPELVLSLHRCVVQGTLDQPDKAGVLRTDADDVRIEDERNGEVIHVPPPASSLPKRLEKLCAFANGEDGEYYIHPILRAIILHFQLAYDHPFVDGNGRTARSLFYWMMLHAGYWMFEFISISHEIFRHAGRYYEAFLHVEEDDNDLNYFIVNQLEVINNSVTALLEYARAKQNDYCRLQRMLAHAACFNFRQMEVLMYFLHHPQSVTSVKIQSKRFRVALQTARTDLVRLAELGLLQSKFVSREQLFFPVADLEQRLRDIGEDLRNC